MPPRASTSLTPQDHAAVFAYILKMNGFPSGTSAVTAASEQLEGAHLRPEGARTPERAARPRSSPALLASHRLPAAPTRPR
jgi:hypothetical protein